MSIILLKFIFDLMGFNNKLICIYERGFSSLKEFCILNEWMIIYTNIQDISYIEIECKTTINHRLENTNRFWVSYGQGIVNEVVFCHNLLFIKLFLFIE